MCIKSLLCQWMVQTIMAKIKRIAQVYTGKKNPYSLRISHLEQNLSTNGQVIWTTRVRRQKTPLCYFINTEWARPLIWFKFSLTAAHTLRLWRMCDPNRQKTWSGVDTGQVNILQTETFFENLGHKWKVNIYV